MVQSLGDQWEEVNELCCSLKWDSPRGHVVDMELPDKPIIEIITVLTSTTKKNIQNFQSNRAKS